MKTLERKNMTTAKPKKQMGQFANMDELADYKTEKVNKMLATIKNLDEYF
jgi:hypothetical protein